MLIQPRASHRHTLVDMLRSRASATPAQTAYTYLRDGEADELCWEYRELDRRARRVAAWLQSYGAAGERALLLYPPGLDYLAAFFGCLYAGVIAVPAYPPQRERGMPRVLSILRDSQAAYALTITSVHQAIERLSLRTSGLEQLAGLRWLNTDTEAPGAEHYWYPPDINADTLAFLQYTSGSTGQPKGVKVSHGNLLHNQRMIQEAFGHTDQDRVVGWLPLYHDMGLIGNVMQPLFLGVPCVLMSPIHFLQKPVRWLSAISRYRATTSGGPNFAYDLCVRQVTVSQRASLDLSTWTLAFNGAEPVRAGTIEQFARTFADCGFRRNAFYPCYGLAEATLLVTGGISLAPPVMQNVDQSALDLHPGIRPVETAHQAQVLVGSGVARLDQQIRIVHPESCTVCPDGQVGEIWVSGPSVAQGYWGQEQETRDTFMALLADTGEGPFLRTGDLGFLSEQELFVTGRLKDLIIIRGRNHYPHDIERTVEESHPALRPGGGAAFSVVEKDEEQLIVVQEVQLRAKNLDYDAVMAEIRQAVARHHGVQVFAVVLIKAGTLPKTSSGKVQRSLCRTKFLEQTFEVLGQAVASTPPQARDLDESIDVVGCGEIAPGQDLEQIVTEIWSQVLHQSTIGPQDDFFVLGGDSLRGAQVLARLREVCRIEMPLETLFDFPILEEFVSQVGTMTASLPASAAVVMRPMPREGAQPLSRTQERFWFLEQLSPGSPFNNIPIALRLNGRLDVETLRRSLHEIIRRHDILRAMCVLRNGRPAQIIVSHLDVRLSPEDLSHLCETDREKELERTLSQEAVRPFDLMTGPLVRLRLFRMAENDHVLSLTLHHIVTDGWSMGIFSRELAELYEAFVNHRVSPLPSLPIQYLDVIADQRQDDRQDLYKRQIEYWRQRLDHVPNRLNLPYDRPRPQVQGYRGARHRWAVEAAVVQRLHTVGRQQRATLFMTLLAAFNVLLSRYSGQADFCVGTPVANRNRIECEPLIGCFVNTVPLRADLSGDPSFPAFLAQVRATVLGAQAHQEVPFERLVDALQVARDLGHTPLFQVMFVLEDSSSDVQSLGALSARRMDVNTQTSVFDLTLEMALKADGTLAAVFEYSTDLFDGDTIARMAEHLHALLSHIAVFPESRVSDLSLLAAKERRQVLFECNDTRRPYPQESCLHELLEARAAGTPDAVAVQCEGRSVTYAALNRKANQLAWYLRAQGVGPESPVALCVDRSLEMVIGLWASLKAGAAYVPIDPVYPRQRQAAILRDVQPRLVLTQQKFASDLPDPDVSIVSLDNDWPAVAEYPDSNLPNLTSPDHLAYLLYTSGTTGRPKGTGVSHRALVNHGTAMVAQYALLSTDRVLQFASVSFDVAAEECFPTWLAGATVVLRPNEPIPAYQDFHAFLRDQVLTVLNLPTPFWAGWVEEIERGGLAIPPLVRLVIVGSEKALPEGLVRWQRVATPRVAWCNSYGPTEATITASSYVAEPDMDWSEVGTVPIGRPIANVELYVLDAHLQPLPFGVPGELYIGGAGLARGYHRLPDLTAERFIPHPFSRRSGERLYRTGDRARRRKDGNVEFLGRSDEQVKIRGFRIELSEIESHTRQHPEVKECRVFLESSPSREWPALLGAVSPDAQEQMLQAVECLTAAEAQWLYALESDAEERRKTVIQRKPEFDVYLKLNQGDFLTPPRQNQRNWLLRRALDEFSDDLVSLDAISKRFVSGSDRVSIEQGWTGSRAEYKPTELIIEGQQVMQDWEAPLMKAMADIATESRGDVLEVGFGMGISASYIQAGHPRSHTIIECNHDVMKAFAEWAGKYPDRDIRLVQGRWQDVVDRLDRFDGVFFDTYPASEEEFEEAVINSINFAEAFIPAAAALLRPGGVFTYYTNEIDSFSRRHQRFLFQHFSSFTLSIVRSLLPPEDCHYWWADSMAVVKAVK